MPKVEAKEPVVITPQDIAKLAIVQVVESPRTIEIVKVESQYDLQQKEQENRLAQVIKDNPLLRKIAECESGNNPISENKHSTASGTFQFLDSSWGNYKGYQRAKDAPEIVQWDKAVETYNKSGTSGWNASRSCWSPQQVSFTQSGDESGEVEVLYTDYTNNCVQFYKNQTGVTRPLGPGGRAGIQGKEPRVGAGGVLKGRPHLVLIEKIEGNTITFKESNYRRNLITRRSLPTSSFLGYIYQ